MERFFLRSQIAIIKALWSKPILFVLGPQQNFRVHMVCQIGGFLFAQIFRFHEIAYHLGLAVTVMDI